MKAAQAQQEAMARLHASVEELSRQVTQLETGKRTLEIEGEGGPQQAAGRRAGGNRGEGKRCGMRA